jgi:predicted acylesterase/phospholipase RssA
MKNSNNNSVALAFSGGGSKVIQFANILSILNKNKINVTAVSGISSGAFIAVLIAAGYTGKEVSCILQENYAKFNKLNFHPRWRKSYGLFSNDHIRDIVNSACAAKNIFKMADFPMPIQLVAYDVLENRKVYFTNKPIEGEYCILTCTPGDAAAATAALPIVYNGKIIYDDDGKEILCSDGGARGNIAVKSLRHVVKDDIIACSYEIIRKKPTGLMSIGCTLVMGNAWILTEMEKSSANYNFIIRNPNAKVLDRGGKHLNEYVKNGDVQIEEQMRLFLKGR